MKTISINGRAATLHKNNILEVINGNHIDYYEIIPYVTDEPKVMIIPREEMNSPEQPTTYTYYSVYCNGTISFNIKIPYSKEEGIDILITYNKAEEDEEIPILGIELIKQEKMRRYRFLVLNLLSRRKNERKNNVNSINSLCCNNNCISCIKVLSR